MTQRAIGALQPVGFSLGALQYTPPPVRTITGTALIVMGSNRSIGSLQPLGLSLGALQFKFVAPTVQTITGVARIQQITLKTISGVGHIQSGATVRTITGVANIFHPATTFRAIGSLQRHGLSLGALQAQFSFTPTIKTIAGKASIHPNQTERVQYGIANIHSPTSVKTINGVARIVPSGTIISTKTISGKANIVPEITAPTAPGSLAVATSGSCNVLTWTAATDAVAVTSYLIYRCSGGGCTSFLFLASVSGTTLSYTDCSVVLGISYSYEVFAMNSGGITGPSSGIVSNLIPVTSSQNISGVAHIGPAGTSTKTITGVASIQSATPTAGVRLTQNVVLAGRHPAGPGHNEILNTQTVLLAGRYPSGDLHNKIALTQVVLLVAIPYKPSKAYTKVGDILSKG